MKQCPLMLFLLIFLSCNNNSIDHTKNNSAILKDTAGLKKAIFKLYEPAKKDCAGCAVTNLSGIDIISIYIDSSDHVNVDCILSGQVDNGSAHPVLLKADTNTFRFRKTFAGEYKE